MGFGIIYSEIIGSAFFVLVVCNDGIFEFEKFYISIYILCIGLTQI